MNVKVILGFGAALLLMPSGSAYAASDEDFIKNVILMNLAEIQMGQLAQAKGVSNEVKTYGQKMVVDHTKGKEEAAALAGKVGVSAPTEAHSAKKKHDELAGLSGEEFDRAFAQHMVQDHQKAIDMFTDKADDGNNEVSSFAQKNLPVLQQHLDQAKTLPGASG